MQLKGFMKQSTKEKCLFKVGDFVTPVHNMGRNYFTFGKVYKITNVNNEIHINAINDKGVIDGWHSRNFELADQLGFNFNV